MLDWLWIVILGVVALGGGVVGLGLGVCSWLQVLWLGLSVVAVVLVGCGGVGFRVWLLGFGFMILGFRLTFVVGWCVVTG